MHFISTAVVLSAIATLGSSFVMETYSDDNCVNPVQNVNVWDHTCAEWPDAFRSMRIVTWGGRAQKGYFFAANNCGDLPGTIREMWVDWTSGNQLNHCYNFNGATANAVASYAA
jgi:hypothetical protein